MFEVLAAAGLTRELGDFALGLRAGVILDGHVTEGGRRHDVEPGAVVALALDWRVFSAPEDPLTLTLGVQLGIAHTSLRDPAGGSATWTALDFRGSVSASRTFGVLTPYVAVRAFGGPVSWRGASGADTTHVQIAAGVAVEVAPWLSLHLEGAVLAERGVFGGIGVPF